jgi:hypothetical protein
MTAGNMAEDTGGENMLPHFSFVPSIQPLNGNKNAPQSGSAVK